MSGAAAGLAAEGVGLLLERPDLLAVAKPAGLPVLPPREDAGARTLRSVLEAAYGERLFVVHRLDRDTSGVLVLARDAEAHRRLSMAFEGRETRKTYLAVCRRARADAPAAGRIDAPLVPGRRGGMRVAAPGARGAKHAVTRFAVLGLEGEIALVEAHPETGRTHQLRVHLAHAGWPLAVDPRYGSAEALTVGEGRCERLTLHARRLVIPAEDLDVTAPLPPDLASVVAAVLHRPLD